MSKIIGIDLGTTNSVVAVMEGGKAKVIPSAEGPNTFPSIVAQSKAGERLVGQLAKRQAVTNPENTVFSVKRLIGRKFSEDEVQKDVKLAPYKIIASGEGVKVKINDKEYTPQEISAFILQKLKTDAESYLGEKVTEAVITVPAYFNDSQRQATKDAGKIAGLEVKRIINEPTAAALAYGEDKNNKTDKKIAVYDFGGGTFDITILEMGSADGEASFEVLSTNGDTHLGGDDLDQKIMDWIIGEFQSSEGINLKSDNMALQRIKEAAEKAKIELSGSQESEINLPFITADANGPKHLVIKLSRAKLEDLVRPLVERTKSICEQAIRDAKIEVKDTDEVILVGGMTRMPMIQEIVKSVFDKEPSKGVNPDEVVALGAAIQGGVLTGEVKDILLLDVTPLTLGLETLGGVMTPLIDRNTTIPTSKSETFSTAADNQTSVEVHILQGERPMASDNRTLGRFILDGIPPSPRGIPQIEVKFDIDANGILNVHALDKASGKEQKITITASSGLSDEEVDKMRKEAESHAEEDKKKKELIEARNIADTTIYSAEKAITDAGDKLDGEIKKDVEDKIAKVKETQKTESIEEIKKITDELGQAMQRIGEAMYKKDDKTTDEKVKPTDEKNEQTDEPTEVKDEDSKDKTDSDEKDKEEEEK